MGSNDGTKIPIEFPPLHSHHCHGGLHHHCHGNRHYHRHHGNRHHHHHHHSFYISRQCPLHSSILQPKNHSPSCTTPYPSPQNAQPVASILPDSRFEFQDFEQPHQAFDDTQMKHDEVVVDDDEEPIFILTDEWREFFAKSEAKRRQAKKGKK